MTRSTWDINMSDARARFSFLIDQAVHSHEPVFLCRRGKRVAAIIDAESLANLIELAEDMADIRAADTARRELAETNTEPIPWDEVKRDLGLVSS